VNACSRCTYWNDLHDAYAGKGECRRFPPTPVLRDRLGDHSWPQTIGRQWCGEFFPKPGEAA
jgi:hypothetical protein